MLEPNWSDFSLEKEIIRFSSMKRRWMLFRWRRLIHMHLQIPLWTTERWPAISEKFHPALEVGPRIWNYWRDSQRLGVISGKLHWCPLLSSADHWILTQSYFAAAESNDNIVQSIYQTYIHLFLIQWHLRSPSAKKRSFLITIATCQLLISQGASVFLINTLMRGLMKEFSLLLFGSMGGGAGVVIRLITWLKGVN